MAEGGKDSESTSKWASWKDGKDVDVTAGKPSKLDIKSSKPSSDDQKADSKSGDGKDFKPRSTAPRGRSYQENRRYDRDRRDNRKKQETKSDSSRAESADKDETSDRRDSKSGREKATESRDKARDGHTSSYKGNTTPTKGWGDSRWRKDDRGRRYDQGSRDQHRSSSDNYHAPTSKQTTPSKDSTSAKDGDHGADLLSLLNKPKEGKSTDYRGKPRASKEIKSKSKSAADLEAQWQKEEAERHRKEEEEQRKVQEEKRKEEERIRKEEEARKQEEEEAQRLRDEEIKTIQDFIHETSERIQFKVALKELNDTAVENRPDESFFFKLDSNLKKNTAFVKKLRNITDSQKESLTKDFNSLNLTKYIGEAATAITEAKLKMSDINCALHICSLLHQRYADFSAILMENWNKVLLTKKDDKVPNPSKLRVDLRFFADLVALGVFTQREGLPVLATQLTLLTGNDKEDHNNLTIVLSFCKHCGDDYAGLMPAKYKLLAEKYNMELPRSHVLPAERQKACRNLLKDYFSSLCNHLLRDHTALQGMKKYNRKIMQTKGELSEEQKQKCEAAVQAFQKLHINATTFADLFEENLPDLPEEEYKPESDEMGCDIYHPTRDVYEYLGDSTLFEDEDTRQFYENLPDLKAVIPQILYKDSEHAVPADTQNDEAALHDDLEKELDVEELEKMLTLEMEGLEVEDKVVDPEPEVKDKEKVKDKVKVKEKQTPSASTSKELAKYAEELELDAISHAITLEAEDDDLDMASSLKIMLETFIASLPNCVSRELIDRAATDFCMNLNTKGNRKKLVRALFTVHRTRYDLLPFYSRLIATLHPCMPEVASDLATLLKGDLRWHVRKKDQINIESKLKTVRYIGELVKFNMFPKSEALHCLKMLMFDFSHHNIEMACSLLETCGRFLYRSPDSHHRTKVYLDVMMRKKAAIHFDQRYTTLIENAYYYSNPPEVKKEAKKVRPPLHEYIRKLLYKDLNKITTEKVLRQIRKLDWDNALIKFYASKCLSSIWNVRYNSVHCCANLLAGLASYHEDVAIQVVDSILEDIRIGMEVNHPKYNQRRVSCTKFLGELYNYRMVDTGVIFKALYSFITFGVSLDEEAESPVDPPEHLFRIRLTCVLLDTCGQYFDGGSSKKKLDYFLAYFQRYYMFKRKHPLWTVEHPFPMEVDYTVRDTLESLRSKLKLHTSYEQAVAAVEEMEKELLAKIADILPKPRVEGEVGTESESESALATIQEGDETDEHSQDLSQVAVTEGTQESDGDRDEATGSQSENRQRHNVADDGEEGQERDDCDQQEDSDDDEASDSELMESAGEQEEDDQVTVVSGGLKLLQCPEDDDFMAAFDKMMTDNIQARSQESVKAPQVEITVPVNIRTHNKPKPPVVTFLGVTPQEREEEEPEESSSEMRFTLLTRRGNKQQLSTLNIPVTENFASKIKEREDAERAEKERMKRVVLDIHERQEEEDYQEMIASMSRPAMVTLNRERKVRYNHPKGAPDADAIFGSK